MRKVLNVVSLVIFTLVSTGIAFATVETDKNGYECQQAQMMAISAGGQAQQVRDIADTTGTNVNNLLTATRNRYDAYKVQNGPNPIIFNLLGIASDANNLGFNDFIDGQVRYNTGENAYTQSYQDYLAVPSYLIPIRDPQWTNVYNKYMITIEWYSSAKDKYTQSLLDYAIANQALAQASQILTQAGF